MSARGDLGGRARQPARARAGRAAAAGHLRYGTNTGLRAVAAGEHGHTEDDLRYTRRRYLTPTAARGIAIEIANATFAARQHSLWGAGTTAVASDSTHFGAFDQNIFTEWHSRDGGRGVLIYWHVERGSVVVHSQLLHCSASEVHAMVDGAIRHGTDMSVESNYVDSHGQSEIGSASPSCSGSTCCPGSNGSTRSSSTAPAPASRTCGPAWDRR